LTVWEEKRVYQALRPLPQSPFDGSLSSPAGQKKGGWVPSHPRPLVRDNEAWNKKIVYPKGLERDWSFRADGSSCPAVVWTTPKSSCAIVTDPTVKFPVKRKGLDDVLGIGFAQMEKEAPGGFHFPRAGSPAKLPGRPETQEAPRAPDQWKKGQTLTHTFYYSIPNPTRPFMSGLAGPFGKGVKTPPLFFQPCET